jgi:hypothetical protein
VTGRYGRCVDPTGRSTAFVSTFSCPTRWRDGVDRPCPLHEGEASRIARLRALNGGGREASSYESAARAIGDGADVARDPETAEPDPDRLMFDRAAFARALRSCMASRKLNTWDIADVAHIDVREVRRALTDVGAAPTVDSVVALLYVLREPHALKFSRAEPREQATRPAQIDGDGPVAPFGSSTNPARWVS